MKIELGTIYQNRTLRYLVPAFNLYGEVFKIKFNTIFKVAFGIQDSLLEGSYLEDQQNIYILIDKAVKNNLFLSYMNWIKLQKYYVADYAYDNLENGRFHMLALAFPEHMSLSYSEFKKGNYSLMYSKDEVESLFKNEEVKAVLLKKDSAFSSYNKILKENFGTELSFEEFKSFNGEYDIPPKREEEYFNYIAIEKVFI